MNISEKNRGVYIYIYNLEVREIFLPRLEIQKLFKRYRNGWQY